MKESQMPLVEWNSSFETGVPSIDEQHRKLFAIINELSDAMRAEKSHVVLGRIVNALVDYTVTHFAHEEKFFATTRYPYTEPHVAEHRRLVAQVEDFATKFGRGEATLDEDLLQFLQHWLTEHILVSDKRYADHLIACGVV